MSSHRKLFNNVPIELRNYQERQYDNARSRKKKLERQKKKHTVFLNRIIIHYQLLATDSNFFFMFHIVEYNERLERFVEHKGGDC